MLDLGLPSTQALHSNEDEHRSSLPLLSSNRSLPNISPPFIFKRSFSDPFPFRSTSSSDDDYTTLDDDLFFGDLEEHVTMSRRGETIDEETNLSHERDEDDEDEDDPKTDDRHDGTIEVPQGSGMTSSKRPPGRGRCSEKQTLPFFDGSYHSNRLNSALVDLEDVSIHSRSGTDEERTSLAVEKERGRSLTRYGSRSGASSLAPARCHSQHASPTRSEYRSPSQLRVRSTIDTASCTAVKSSLVYPLHVEGKVEAKRPFSASQELARIQSVSPSSPESPDTPSTTSTSPVTFVDGVELSPRRRSQPSESRRPPLADIGQNSTKPSAQVSAAVLPSPSLKKRPRSTTALDLRSLAYGSYSSLLSSISHLAKSPVNEAAPPAAHLESWSNVKTVNVRFGPRNDDDATVNSWLLGLYSIQAGGTRSWDPRSLSPIDTSSVEQDGHKGESNENEWPSIRTSTGSPSSIEVVYRNGQRRCFSPERLNQEEIMRAVLTPTSPSA